MNARWRFVATAAVTGLVSLSLVSCGSLPRSLKDDIAAEHDRLQQADRQLKRSGDTIRQELAANAALFQGSSVATDWPAHLKSAQTKLDRAKAEGAELDKAARGPGNNETRRHAQELLNQERELRLAALRDTEAVDTDAAKWLDYKNNAAHYLARMQDEYNAVRTADLSKVTAAVQKAETDWPAKKADLDARLASLKQSSADVESQWKATEAARKEAAAGALSGASVATLIQADDTLGKEATGLTAGADQLIGLSGQLYNSWDRILEDLDKNQEGSDTVYREKVKTVRTHFVDVAAKKTEVSTDSAWTDVSAGAYRSVENDLGMAIGHKDAGLYDSEAQTTPQPPGFAYIATPEQGRNQYGYWDHSSAGSVWTWLPEYLIMRQLFWGPSYRPVVVNEFNSYYSAQRMGRSYYGNETPAAPPRYGTHGTFTEQRYAGSRYVQSGGFKGSGYASGGAAGSAASRSTPSGSGFGEGEGSSAGKRFGGRPSGEGFGSPAPSGKRFGGGSPRMPSRSFGGRRR
jgi:hypothetical protein